MKRLLLALLLLPTLAYANDFYTHGSFPATGTQATSAGMRAELDAISAGFDKLPTLSGNANKILVVNSSGTAITTTAGSITVPDYFSIQGNYGLTLNLSGTTGVTLPTSGTLATLAGTETLTNKTLTNPTLSLNSTISGTVAATGQLEIQGTGTNAIGASRVGTTQLKLGGSFSPASGSNSHALHVNTTIAGQVSQNAYGALIAPTITEAASGTHALIASMEVDPPTITNAGATTTKAVGLYVGGTPSGGTTNYSLEVAGNSTFGGTAAFTNAAVTISGGLVPTLTLNDGTTDSYVQVANGNVQLYGLGHTVFAPGLGEKARVSSDGILAIGTTDTASVTAGGLVVEGGKIRLSETTDPTAPATNKLVLYAVDDGSGNTVLAVRFPTGSPVAIARENTGVIPPGTVHFWAGSSAPSGWLLANGSNVSRTTYATLFAAIGTTFGSGDGSTTFGLPNLSNYATNVKAIIKC